MITNLNLNLKRNVFLEKHFTFENFDIENFAFENFDFLKTLI